MTPEDILEDTINKFIGMGMFKREDMAVKDIRKEEYANIVFKPSIYENRKKVLNFLKSLDIVTVERFGEWKYLWSDQSLISGKMGAEKVVDGMQL